MAHTRKKQARQKGTAKALHPLEVEAGKFLGHYQRREFDQAFAMAEMLTTRFPEQLFVWKALGTCLLEMGEPEKAISPLQQALTLVPDDLESNTNIAKALNKLGRYDEASQYIKNALYIDPHNYQANMWMAEIHSARDEYSLAIQHLETSIETTPDSVISRLRHATELVNKREYSDALQILEELVLRFPGHPSVNGNLANLYGTMGRFPEAERQYRKTIELVPKDSLAFSNYYFTAHYNPAHDAQSLHELALEWAVRYSPEPRPARAETDRRADRQLRIGMISSGLRMHPVGQMITAVLENVSRHEISFHAYSDKLATDEIARRIKNIVSGWRDIGHLNDDALADLIRSDQIDILIDMTGHTAGNRLKAIAKEPAPLIIKWVGGLFNTTGLKAVDYLISDSIETPADTDALYLEKLIRMPDDYICYMKPAKAPEPSVLLPAHDNGYITLGCFNNPAKINEPLLTEWAELMRQLPESKLFLKGGQYTNEAYCGNIAGIMERNGISRDRILMEGPASHSGLMQAYDRVDIALDPWPYSGGLSTCEALLMGVPVVTLPGPTFAGRHSATHLVNAGLPELVTDTWDEYRARVVELATDLDSLATIRTHLREILLRSPVCDGPRFAKNFTVAMRAIWQRYCEDKSPAALTLNQQSEARFEDEAQPVVLVHPEPFEDEQREFSWQLKSKIIAVDHGCQLMENTVIHQMLKLKTLELIAFDPASKGLNSLFRKRNGVHYYPNAMLGDGEPAILHACHDPVLSGTLDPLPAERLPEDVRLSAQVITKLSISTLTLDSIKGLESLDWLLLDELNDASTILEHGSTILRNALLIEVRIAFQPTHQQQPSLDEISHWASSNSFRFYHLGRMDNRSHLPTRPDLKKRQSTELVRGNALFIPNHARMAELSDEQRTKLAFLLHTIYGIRDLSYELLAAVDQEKAEAYLVAEGIVPAPVISSPSKNRDIEAPALKLDREITHTMGIGIPVFNEEKYIEQTLRSLQAQDLDDVLYVISDNASTDRTQAIIRDITAGDSRFRIHQHADNVGSASNFRFVLERTNSQYFMWLGAHDYLSDNYLKSVLGLLRNNPEVAMACGTPFSFLEDQQPARIEQAIYDFSGADPVARYLKSAAELANCTILHSIFERKLLDGFGYRHTISLDHVIISHLLWSGKLAYSQDAGYFRRFFKQRTETQEERLLGIREAMPRKDFYRFYEDDFAALLAADPNNAALAPQLREKLTDILHRRFD